MDLTITEQHVYFFTASGLGNSRLVKKVPKPKKLLMDGNSSHNLTWMSFSSCTLIFYLTYANHYVATNEIK